VSGAAAPGTIVGGVVNWAKNQHFKFKKTGFLRSTNFKLLRLIKRNLINNCDFLIPSFMLGVDIVIICPGRRKP